MNLNQNYHHMSLKRFTFIITIIFMAFFHCPFKLRWIWFTILKSIFRILFLHQLGQLWFFNLYDWCWLFKRCLCFRNNRWLCWWLLIVNCFWFKLNWLIQNVFQFLFWTSKIDSKQYNWDWKTAPLSFLPKLLDHNHISLFDIFCKKNPCNSHCHTNFSMSIATQDWTQDFIFSKTYSFDWNYGLRVCLLMKGEGNKVRISLRLRGQ